MLNSYVLSVSEQSNFTRIYNSKGMLQMC